jgi:hypothetical protein
MKLQVRLRLFKTSPFRGDNHRRQVSKAQSQVDQNRPAGRAVCASAISKLPSRIGADRCRARVEEFSPAGAVIPSSEQAAAVWHGLVGLEQHNRPGRVGETERQNLGHELADLARRKVHHGDNPPAKQGVG